MNRKEFRELNACFVNKICLQQSFTILTLSSFSACPGLLELFNTKRTNPLETCESKTSHRNLITNSPGNIIAVKTVHSNDSPLSISSLNFWGSICILVNIFGKKNPNSYSNILYWWNGINHICIQKPNTAITLCLCSTNLDFLAVLLLSLPPRFYWALLILPVVNYENLWRGRI